MTEILTASANELVYYAFAILVGIVSTARITRLVAQDSFPPAVWLRVKWDNATEDGSWNILLHCHWCLTPWVIIPIGAWGFFSDLHMSWWLFNGWLAFAYIAAMIVEKDEAAQ